MVQRQNKMYCQRGKQANMKRIPALAIACLATVFFMACEKNVNPSSACIGLSDSTVIQIKYGQNKILCDNDSSCISFTKIVTESRCPSDVVCVWAGTAIIELGTCDIEGGAIALEIYKPIEYTIDGQKYSVELTALNPYPSVAHPANRNDYVATITIKSK
jgi:hypothetical protein